ncbi:MAG: hypothetical protein KAS36_13455 [Anaerolineales bacterium]|nr:hypothetical protein [Anaerolineales bacterium]
MSPTANFKIPKPQNRMLRVFAFDPALSTNLDTAVINKLTLSVPWEDLKSGPVGEYLEVVDIDPASGNFYPPVNLDNPYLLVQHGLAPSEGTPQFHQQMVYAVTSKTIQNFERALGRPVLWSPRQQDGREEFVRRIRIYPHALRQANAYYSPRKKAILFGYFPASKQNAGRNLPGGIVFTCLSHDIITHETTHALLDGLHPYFAEPSNLDVLSLHEAFADIVALFQHFSHAEVLKHQIARTRGDLTSENLLAELARQFGEAIGKRGALRNAIGKKDPKTGLPDPTEIHQAREPHQRGSILVAAVFDAFLTVYKNRSLDLLRIATGGTGVLPEGAIHPDLVKRLAAEAAKTSQRILTMCVRALDYCPPVDITFGEYLRAIITADRDLFPDGRDGHRIAMIESFRQRGIYPSNVRSLSEESLLWLTPGNDKVLANFFIANCFSRLKEIHKFERLQKQRGESRRGIFMYNQAFRGMVRNWVQGDLIDAYKKELGSEEEIEAVVRNSLRLKLFPDKKMLSLFTDDTGRPELEVNSTRLAYRIGPAGRTITDLVVEINQRRHGYLDPNRQRQADEGTLDMKKYPGDFIFRGGATMLIDIETGEVRFVISKRIGSNRRLNEQRKFLGSPETSMRYTYFGGARLNYFKGAEDQGEPFALLHGDDLEED